MKKTNKSSKHIAIQVCAGASIAAACIAAPIVVGAINNANQNKDIPPENPIKELQAPVLKDSPCYDVAPNGVQQTYYWNANRTGTYNLVGTNDNMGTSTYTTTYDLSFSRSSITFGYSIVSEDDLSDFISDSDNGYVNMVDAINGGYVNNVKIAMRDGNGFANLNFNEIQHRKGATDNAGREHQDYDYNYDGAKVALTGKAIGINDTEVVWDAHTHVDEQQVKLKYATTKPILSHLIITRDHKLKAFAILFDEDFQFQISAYTDQGGWIENFYEGAELSGRNVALHDTPAQGHTIKDDLNSAPITMNNSICALTTKNLNDVYEIQGDQTTASFNVSLINIDAHEIVDPNILTLLWHKELVIKYVGETDDCSSPTASFSAPTPSISIVTNEQQEFDHIEIKVDGWETNGTYFNPITGIETWSCRNIWFRFNVVDSFLQNQVIYSFTVQVHNIN